MAEYNEKKVKALVKKVLTDSKRWGTLYSYWPVPYGMGASSLDCLVCYRGMFIGIETKAPGKHPTPRQELCIRQIVEAGGTTLVLDSTDMTPLEETLDAIRSSVPEGEGADLRSRWRKRPREVPPGDGEDPGQ